MLPIKMPRECKNKPYKFCFKCGLLTITKYKRSIIPRVKKIIQNVFWN